MLALRREDDHSTKSGLLVLILDASPGGRSHRCGQDGAIVGKTSSIRSCFLAAGRGSMSRMSKEQSVAAVRSALVFSRSAALAEYGGFPDLHYYVMEGRQPSALQLLSDRDTRLAIGDALNNLASACDRGAQPAKSAAARKLRASRLGLLDAFAPDADDVGEKQGAR
jgi:hypothetical protein